MDSLVQQDQMEDKDHLAFQDGLVQGVLQED